MTAVITLRIPQRAAQDLLRLIDAHPEQVRAEHRVAVRTELLRAIVLTPKA